MWAVRYSGRRCRLFHDMIEATRFYAAAEKGSRLYKRQVWGWEVMAWHGYSGRSVRQLIAAQRMNREVLVQEEANG